MDKNTLITVVNRYSGVVGYEVPELQVHRNFFPNEHKEISYEELEKLSFNPGGEVILREYLEITDKEYFYSEADVEKIMKEGTLDQFLDCLDFAPSVILDMIKNKAVEMPLNDVAKRNAIKEKLGFDVTRAIEIKNTKYDGETEAATVPTESSGRRTAPPKAETAAPTGRRYQAPKKES